MVYLFGNFINRAVSLTANKVSVFKFTDSYNDCSVILAAQQCIVFKLTDILYNKQRLFLLNELNKP